MEDPEYKILGEETLAWLNARRRAKYPRMEKWLDARHHRHYLKIFRFRLNEYIYNSWWLFSKNGIPAYERGTGWFHYKPSGIFRYCLNAPSRSKGVRWIRARNGTREWLGDGDAWAKRPVMGKSGRHRNRDIKQWWIEAIETLKEIQSDLSE